jgi:chromosome segregation ATPase
MSFGEPYPDSNQDDLYDLKHPDIVLDSDNDVSIDIVFAPIAVSMPDQNQEKLFSIADTRIFSETLFEIRQRISDIDSEREDLYKKKGILQKDRPKIELQIADIRAEAKNIYDTYTSYSDQKVLEKNQAAQQYLLRLRDALRNRNHRLDLNASLIAEIEESIAVLAADKLELLYLKDEIKAELGIR